MSKQGYIYYNFIKPNKRLYAQRAYHRKAAYGLSKKDYTAMRIAQGSRCKLCRKVRHTMAKPLHVDHDHVTDTVRGLLCRTCNLGLGMLGDSIEKLQLAMDYLMAARQTEVEKRVKLKITKSRNTARVADETQS